MTTLYASDLDGTLLNAQAQISPAAADTIRRLNERGALITFVTARTPATIEPILRAAFPPIPGVAMTGAALWHCQSRSYEQVQYHCREDVIAVSQACQRHGVTPFVYTLPRGSNALVVYHSAPTLSSVEARFVADRTLNDLKTFHLGTHAPESSLDCTVLFFAMGTPESIEAVAADIRSCTDCYASCYPDTYNPGLALLEVFTHGVSKAEGLITLKRRVGADRIVAFGDNLNDIPMLQAADVAVAVDNAHPDVKAAADVVIGPNTDDAVPRFILEDFSI